MGHVSKILLFLVITVLRTDHYFLTGVGGGGAGGMVGKFSHAKIFLTCGSCCKQVSLCPRLPANTFFTCIQSILVFTASANNLFQNFPPHPPPRQKNNDPSLSSFTHTRNTRIDYEKHSKQISSATENKPQNVFS